MCRRIGAVMLITLAFSGNLQSQQVPILFLDSEQTAFVRGDAGSTHCDWYTFWDGQLSDFGETSNAMGTPSVWGGGEFVLGQLSATSSTALTQSINTSNLAHNALFWSIPGGWIFDESRGSNNATYQVSIPAGKEVWIKVTWNFQGFANYDGWNFWGGLAANANASFQTTLGINGEFSIADDDSLPGGGFPEILVTFPGGSSNQNFGERWVQYIGGPIQVTTETSSVVSGDQLIGHITGWSFAACNFTVVQAVALPLGSGPPSF